MNSGRYIQTLYFYIVCLLCLLLCSPYKAEADNSTCIALPSVSTNPEVQKTIFGFLKQAILIDQESNSELYNKLCSDGRPTLVFNFNFKIGNDAILVQNIKLHAGESKLLSTLVGQSVFDQLNVNDVVITASQNIATNTMCINVPTPYGVIPLSCKTTTILSAIADPILDCSLVAKSCSVDGFHSQTIMNFSGRAIQCLKDSLDRVFFVQSLCGGDDGVKASPVTPFPEFKDYMYKAVMAFVTLYLISFGIKLLLDPGNTSPNQSFLIILKAILVMYFAAGLGNVIYKNGKPYKANGVLEWGLPIFSQATNNFALFVMNSISTEGLCIFEPQNYPSGFGYYALWDSLDCRIGYYLGFLPSYNVGAVFKGLHGIKGRVPSGAREVTVHQPGYSGSSTDNSMSRNQHSDLGSILNTARDNINVAQDALTNIGLYRFDLYGANDYKASYSGPNVDLIDHSSEISYSGLHSDYSLRLFTALWGYFLVGNFFIILVCLAMVVVIIGTVLNLFSTYCLSLITLYVMAYISPIFVPMILFQRTKNYFNGWLKISVSCAIRPAVVTGFIAVLFIAYDNIFFRNCSFIRYNYIDGNVRFSTFNPAVPQTFSDDVESCVNSMGYRLFQKYIGYDWDNISLIFFKIDYVTDGWTGLDGIAYLFFCTIILYYFGKMSDSVSSEISGGVSMAAVTVSATDVMMKARGAVKSGFHTAKFGVETYKNIRNKNRNKFDDKQITSRKQEQNNSSSDNKIINNPKQAGDQISSKSANSGRSTAAAGKQAVARAPTPGGRTV